MAVKINIDGKDYQVDESLSLIEACESVGIEIPHFCYHPGLGPDGNCRMCQVELVTPRGRQLVISCNTRISEGMVVETQSDRARQVRAGVEEFLLLNHPLDCPICDKMGECTLQKYYMEHDLQDSFLEFKKYKKGKAIVLGEALVLDQERCILCDRCVRFLRDVAGTEELYIAGRGHEAYLTTFPGKEVKSPYSLNTVDLCPVGALTSRDFRFHSPVWFLRTSESVCTTCARGCSIEIDHRDGKIYRLRPRYNPHVNGHWMCDEGRLNYKFVNENRAETCSVSRSGERIDVTYEEALTAATELLAEKRALVLASAICTLEEMFILEKLSSGLDGAQCFVVLHNADGVEDDLLRKRDRHPNTSGAKLLGMEMVDLRDSGDGSGEEELRKLSGPETVLVACGFDYGVSERLKRIVASSSATIALAARLEDPMDRVDVIFPCMTFAEKEGTLVNFEFHAQALHPANVGNNYVPEGFDLPVKGLTQWRVVSDLLVRAGHEGYHDIGALRAAMRLEKEAVAKYGLGSLGEWGFGSEGFPPFVRKKG